MICVSAPGYIGSIASRERDSQYIGESLLYNSNAASPLPVPPSPPSSSLHLLRLFLIRCRFRCCLLLLAKELHSTHVAAGQRGPPYEYQNRCSVCKMLRTHSSYWHFSYPCLSSSHFHGAYNSLWRHLLSGMRRLHVLAPMFGQSGMIP